MRKGKVNDHDRYKKANGYKEHLATADYHSNPPHQFNNCFLQYSPTFHECPLIERTLSSTAFDLLQLRHDDDAYNDEQEPGADFADVDKRPSGRLIGILPGT
jgi:hypothetical protein